MYDLSTSPPPAVTRPAAGIPAAPPRRRASRRRRDLIAGTICLAPVLLSLVVFRLLPALDALRLSVMRGLPGGFRPPRFVGLDNFRTLFTSDSFWNSMQQTLLFNVLVNPIQILAALVLALLLSQRVPGAGLWRTLIFLPAAVPMVGSTIVWGLALRPEGPVNGLISALGGEPQPFFTSPDQVLWSLILLASWIGIGYWMMFLIAGLQDIPAMYYEAARIDGAGPVRQFFSVTLPLLRRPLLFVLVADTVSNFVLFAPVQVLTRGGPQESSNLLMYDVYHNQFDLSDPYTASAELLLLLLLMLTVVAVQFRLIRSDD